MNKILIIELGGIGDWLCFSPVLRSLLVNCPRARLEVILGNLGTRKVIAFYPEVRIRDAVDMEKKPYEIIKALLKTWPTKYDALIFTAGINSRKADFLSLLVRAEKKALLRRDSYSPRLVNLVGTYDTSVHRIDNNLRLLDLLGIARPTEKKPYLPIMKKPEAVAGSVLIHPGCDAANPYRRWPTERFAAVAEGLLQQDRRVSVILGPGEPELAKEFSSLEGRPGFELFQRLSLAETFEVIAVHESLLNNDSGLGHVAAALGRRTVTIFGPSDPRLARPYSDDAVALRTPSELPCMPCVRSGGRYGCPERPCLMEIEVSSVLRVFSGDLDLDCVWWPKPS